MAAGLQEKTNRHEGVLTDALNEAIQVIPDETHPGATAADCLEMVELYLDDGRHSKVDDDWVNALASFSYGYDWLGAGVRMGLFDIPDDSHLFTM